MKTITVLSGKGGVGKSSITASLAVAFSEKKKIICADCDVDASNLSLVLGVRKMDSSEEISTSSKAVFDLDKCNSCKKCFDACHFDAIEWVDEKPRLLDFSCEGCGVCRMICPQDAIKIETVRNAELGHVKTQYGFVVVGAQLGIGESGSGEVVSVVKNKAEKLGKDSDIMLVDSAAGIGCPVIASVTGSDYCIVITEPTPSGISDMKRAIEIIDHFRIPYSIIINKHDINANNTKIIEEFASENGVKVLKKIPYKRVFMDALVNMTPVIELDESLNALFEDLAGRVLEETGL